MRRRGSQPADARREVLVHGLQRVVLCFQLPAPCFQLPFFFLHRAEPADSRCANCAGADGASTGSSGSGNDGPCANDKLYVLVLIPSIALSHPHLRPALGRTSPASFVPLQRCPAAKEKQPGAMSPSRPSARTKGPLRKRMSIRSPRERYGRPRIPVYICKRLPSAVV